MRNVLRRLWGSGWVRLAVLGLVAVGVIAVVGSSDGRPAPGRADRAAAERVRLRKLRLEQARLQVLQSRDPATRRERARLKAEQRAHFDSAPVAARPSRAGQAALVTALEQSITRDANRRHRSGELDKPTLKTYCVHLVRPQVPTPPPPALSAAQAGYECTAATAKLHTVVSHTGTAILGFPFWARVNFRSGRYAWCKINLLPSEHGIGASLAFVPLPPVCDVLKGGGPA